MPIYFLVERVIISSCYCSEFPDGCLTYEGPHSYHCLANLWIDSGCLETGEKHPQSLSAEEVAAFNKLTLR